MTKCHIYNVIIIFSINYNERHLRITRRCWWLMEWRKWKISIQFLKVFLFLGFFSHKIYYVFPVLCFCHFWNEKKITFQDVWLFLCFKLFNLFSFNYFRFVTLYVLRFLLIFVFFSFFLVCATRGFTFLFYK